MHKYLLVFLKALEKEVPPPANCHHAITYAQYGSDLSGWEDRLAVQINRDGEFSCIFLDERDFRNGPQWLAEVVAAWSKASGSKVQQGVGFGQYLPVKNANSK